MIVYTLGVGRKCLQPMGFFTHDCEGFQMTIYCVYGVTPSGLRYHSTFKDWAEAEDQSDYICGVVIGSDHREIVGDNGEIWNSYRFATDSEQGHIYAKNWDEAQDTFRRMVPELAIENGGWGWIEDSASRDRVERGVLPSCA